MPESIFKNTACRLPPAHMRKQNKTSSMNMEKHIPHELRARGRGRRWQEERTRENWRKVLKIVRPREREREERHASVITSHLYRWQLIRWAIVPRDGSQVTSTNTKTHKMKCVSLFSTSRSHDEEEQQDEEDVWWMRFLLICIGESSAADYNTGFTLWPHKTFLTCEEILPAGADKPARMFYCLTKCFSAGVQSSFGVRKFSSP